MKYIEKGERRWVCRKKMSCCLLSRTYKTERNIFLGSLLKNNTKRLAANLGDIYNNTSTSHFRKRKYLRIQLLFLLQSARHNIHRKDLLCSWTVANNEIHFWLQDDGVNKNSLKCCLLIPGTQKVLKRLAAQCWCQACWNLLSTWSRKTARGHTVPEDPQGTANSNQNSKVGTVSG